ncbi:MAG: tetratricopeptide repeat protein [Smithellaceae bacterium]|nr:tetratricopeptide repeat protein [Smithellaceae bacterium]
MPYEKQIKKKIPRVLRAGLYFIGLIMAICLLALAIYLFLALFSPPQAKDLEYLATRTKNAFQHYILKEKPRFYRLLMEKNGQDLELREGDRFEVFYRDEFVIKEIVSDAITGKGITVDVEGLGTENDYQAPLRGIELVDQTIKGRLAESGRRGATPFRILVRYGQDVIVQIPVAVKLTPQDWLRHARATDNEMEQIDFLKKALAMNPLDTSVRKTLAGLYEKRKMMTEAIAQYRELIGQQPRDVGAWQDLTRIYLELKDYEEVVRTSEALVRLNPRDNNARLNMATAYESLGKREKAIDTYQEALKNDPANPEIHYRLGDAYEKAGSFGKAIEHYREALSKRPQDHNIMMALAEASLKGGKQDEAIKWLEEVVKVQPRSAAAFANLGAAYGAKGMVKEEINAYRKSLGFSPDDQTVRFNLAVAYEKSKMDKEAAVEYRKLWEKKPDDPEILERLANAFFRDKNYKQAVEYYDKLVSDKSPKKNGGKPVNKSRNKGRIYANMAYAFGELKEYRKSARNYELALEQGVKDPIIHYNLGVTYEEMKNKKDAMKAYERYAELQPTLEVLEKLARYYEDNVQFDNAIKAYLRLEKMTTSSDGKAFYFFNMGDISAKQGSLDKAIEYYRNSLKYNSKEGEVYFRLAEAYEKKKMYQEARQNYTKALEYDPSLEQAKKKIYDMGILLTKQKFN